MTLKIKLSTSIDYYMMLKENLTIKSKKEVEIQKAYNCLRFNLESKNRNLHPHETH